MPNSSPITSCIASTSAGARSAVRLATRGTIMLPSTPITTANTPMQYSPMLVPPEKPTSTISRPEIGAPILGRKASSAAIIPSKAAIGTP